MDPEEIASKIENRLGVYPDQITREDLRAAGCSELVCLLPNDFNERVRHLGNVLVQMLTRHQVDDGLRSTVGTISQALSYILNSTSWDRGELKDFDYDEVCRKLNRFTKRG